MWSAFGTTATVRPSETLEYCVRFENSGSGAALQLNITDTLQQVQRFVVNAYASGHGFRILGAGGNEAARYTTAQDADPAEWNEPAGQLTYRQGDLVAGGQGSLSSVFRHRSPRG